MKYFDMHCHLDFAPNAASVATELDACGLGAFAVSVLPSGVFSSDPKIPTPKSMVRFGVGLHPWWIADGRAGEEEIRAVTDAIATSRFVGEVGLDFGKSHGHNQEMQRMAFRRIAQTCAELGQRVLSIHSVHAAQAALDILDEAGTLATCTCIFHWYSDTSDMLARALACGCYFSVGALMLESKRGREYARQIPQERLLFETDEPPEGQIYRLEAMQQQLAQTCHTVAQLKHINEEELAALVAKTSRALLT